MCDEIKCLQKDNYHRNEHACASLMLMLNSNKAELDVHRNDYKKMLEHHDVECGSDQLATTCLVSFVVFPACANHVTLPPKEGGRLS